MTSHQSKGQMQSTIELVHGTVLSLHWHLESQFSEDLRAPKWGEYLPIVRILDFSIFPVGALSLTPCFSWV
jgi:hypothetical protein